MVHYEQLLCNRDVVLSTIQAKFDIDNKVSARSHGADVAAKLKELGVDER